MKKIDIGQTLQILANVGVIAGIVFLAAELSRNTDAMRAQTVHAFQSELREVFDFSDRYVKATLKDPANRRAEDEFVRRAFSMRLMRIFENQWYQYSTGYLDPELFHAYQQHLRFALGYDDFARLRDIRKRNGYFHPGFVAYVDAFTAENPPYSIEEMAKY